MPPVLPPGYAPAVPDQVKGTSAISLPLNISACHPHTHAQIMQYDY